MFFFLAVTHKFSCIFSLSVIFRKTIKEIEEIFSYLKPTDYITPQPILPAQKSKVGRNTRITGQ